MLLLKWKNQLMKLSLVFLGEPSSIWGFGFMQHCTVYQLSLQSSFLYSSYRESNTWKDKCSQFQYGFLSLLTFFQKSFVFISAKAAILNWCFYNSLFSNTPCDLRDLKLLCLEKALLPEDQIFCNFQELAIHRMFPVIKTAPLKITRLIRNG